MTTSPLTTASKTWRAVLGKLDRQQLWEQAQHVLDLWRPYSRLFLVSDTAAWVIAWELRELATIAHRIGVRLGNRRWLTYARNQAVFYGSHFDLLSGEWPDQPHRLGTAYFHGRPGTPDASEFDRVFNRLCHVHQRIHRIQVSHSEMREIVLGSGIAPEKVFLIPIGINLAYFPVQTPESRKRARALFAIPDTAVVVGSFQKDGVGWGAGEEPKPVKGPDVFVQTVKRLKERIPSLFVLLSGPARGYVQAGLAQLGVPYRHVHLERYPEVSTLYHALDIYIVASRQEGGPKAVLESMASGIPLVTTRVGQAMDLVSHGENGWIVDVEDDEELAHWAEYTLQHQRSTANVTEQGRATAEEHTYQQQLPEWRSFLSGFVEF